ncbi:hypothetical protein C1645_831814 [Glomus cerebriforme]|uniref:Uncharacterized protein n=1 Tax=Glomus cerebriforme TaxID=658196 RepID=A0A397SFF0_9GLOM|nr:hypothetical protein C1645_831814 [Glomus cerebriforme]
MYSDKYCYNIADIYRYLSEYTFGVLYIKNISDDEAFVQRYNSFRLSCHFTKIGLKSVTVACTESQFFGIFGGYIYHHSNKSRVYKCIFGGSDASLMINTDDVIMEEVNPLD